MNAAFQLAALTALLSLSTTNLWGQTLAYRHHSTIAGDYFGGAAELVRAQGSYVKDAASAAETWTRVVAAEDALAYQRAEYRFQTKQLDLKYRQMKFDDRKSHDEADTAQRIQTARRLWAEAQHGSPTWPAALARPEYASSMGLIESTLRHWTPDASPWGDAYRRSLATETGVVRARVAADQTIPFASRVKAVRTLDSLKMLAEQGPGSELSEQIAMR